MTVTIEQSILNYNKVIVDSLEKLKVVHSKYICVETEDLRKHYDIIREIIKKKQLKSTKERTISINV